jgi:O-acetyl-ADP-ribose deacetylase (regulator of RNase III)
MIKWVSGDILQTNSQYLAQGVAVGSQEGLGTGLAFKISSKWPDAQKEFKKFTRNNKFEGGDLFAARPGENRLGIIYIATQPDMYHATISFLNKGLKNLASYCLKNSVKSVSIPKIGAGLGKLDWETEVKPLIIRHLESSDTMFFVYEEFRNEFEK